MSNLEFDPLTTNAGQLQYLLSESKITSVRIIEIYLAQIEAFNTYVNAFISVAPRNTLLKTAASLDDERASGSLRSPYHGIPIVLKVYRC